ncbi:MAG TPA: hypothetical protein VNL74_01600 [Methylococcus sp.]|nr:hypothetical protein [Methylococcus sp.]
MEKLSDLLTTAVGLLFLAVMAFEIKRRRDHLREVYNVLDAEDRKIVGELDRMVELGDIQPYSG